MPLIVVERVEKVSGAIEGVPSRLAARVLAALGARGRVYLRGVGRGGLGFLDVLYARLGYSVEWVGENVVVEAPERTAPVQAVVNIGCDYHALGFAAVVASVAAPPFSRIVFRGSCDWLKTSDLRSIVEAVATIGGRAWRGDTLARLLVVEVPGSTAAYPRIWRFTRRLPWSVEAALVVAAALLGDRIIVFQRGFEEGVVNTVVELLRGQGLNVDAGGGVVRVEGSASLDVDVRVPSGYYETSIPLVLARRGRLEVHGLPETLGGEEEVLDALRLGGIGVERECSNQVCKATAAWTGGSRGFVWSIGGRPYTLPLLLALASVLEAEITVSGVDKRDWPLRDRFENLLRAYGVEAVLEEDRLFITGFTEPRDRIVCPEGMEEVCIALLAGLAGSPRAPSEIVVETAVEPSRLLPGLLEALWSIGVSLEVSG